MKSSDEYNTIPPFRELMVSKNLKQIMKQLESWDRYYEIAEGVEPVHLGMGCGDQGS